jgi:bisphosphoglycerate-independent phosphoglycerate mutase (AlkP superfamily)
MQQEIVAVINFDQVVFITAHEGNPEIMILLNRHTMNSVSSGITDTFMQKY